WYSPLTQAQPLAVYRPLEQLSDVELAHATPAILFRTGENAQPALDAVRRIMAEATHDPFLAEQVISFDLRIGAQLTGPRFNAIALGSVALFGLLLASMGIYGVVAQAVGRRTREMGIRVALGAKPRSPVTLVSRRAVTLALLGIAGGALGSLGLTRIIRS